MSAGNDDMEVTFYKSACKSGVLYVANTQDISWVDITDIRKVNETPSVDHRLRYCFYEAQNADG